MNGSRLVSSQGQRAFCLLTRKCARASPNELNSRFLPSCPLSLPSPLGNRLDFDIKSSRALSIAVQETTTNFAGCSCSSPSGSR